MPRLPAGALAGHSVAAVQAAAAQAAMAAQVAALEQLRDKLEAGEPPEKKMALPTEEHHRLLQRALQHNLLAMTAQIPMNIRINNQGAEHIVEFRLYWANASKPNQTTSQTWFSSFYIITFRKNSYFPVEIPLASNDHNTETFLNLLSLTLQQCL